MTQTRDVDFDKLTLKDALDLAMLVEQEAKDRYEELAEQMELHHNPEVAELFRKMKGIEAKHESQVTARRRALFGDAPRAVRREMIFDVEAPDYDEARATMTVRQALEVSLRSEKKAWAFFDAALAKVKDPEVRSLFAELRSDEADHQKLVEAQIARLPPDPPIDLGDASDEPVAH